MIVPIPTPYEEHRPWGFFRQFTHDEVTTVKVLGVNADGTLSKQSHNERAEFWRVLKGHPEVTIGELVTRANPGDEFWIPQGAVHRLAGTGDDAEVLEIAFGHFDENDITRYEDIYGRV